MQLLWGSLDYEKIPSYLEPSGISLSDGRSPDRWADSMEVWSCMVWDATYPDTFPPSHVYIKQLLVQGMWLMRQIITRSWSIASWNHPTLLFLWPSRHLGFWVHVVFLTIKITTSPDHHPSDLSITLYVPFIHNPGVHGRFYRLNLKMEVVVLENKPCRSPD